MNFEQLAIKGLVLGLLSVFLLNTAHGQDETVDVPLYIYNSSTTGGLEYKVGISLNLGESGTYSGYHLYEFDTGGTGLYSGTGGSLVWGATPNITSPLTMSYASGNSYSAVSVTTNVSFGTGVSDTGAAVTLTATSASVGMITSATNPNKGPTDPINNWNTTITSGSSPLDSYFYGDFGMSLSSTNGLAAIVPQLPGNLNTGYIINLGAYPGANTSEGQVGQGALQIGLSAAERDPSNYAQVIFLGTSSGTYPSSGQSLYPEVTTGGVLTISGSTTMGVQSSTSVSSGILFDTGAPDATIHTGSTGAGYDQIGPFVSGTTSGPILPGEDLTLTGSDGTGDTALSINPTGDITNGLNYVKTETTDAVGFPGMYTNTGIDAFWGNEVVFDLADGFIGINPVPEPAPLPLLFLGVTGLSILKIRKLRG